MKKRKHSSTRRNVVVLAAAALVVIGGLVYSNYHTTGQNPVTHLANTQYSTQPSSTPNVSVITNTPSPNNGTSDKTSSNSPAPAVTAPPEAPTGSDFASDYNISLSANPLEQSACNVQPGVSCDIYLTNNFITKDLGAQASNSSGYVLWDWTPQGIGLSVGSWTVKAVASFNGQTSTTLDANSLEVTP